MAKGNGSTKTIGASGASAATKTNFAGMDIKEARKELLGRTLTIADYWSDGRGHSVDATGEIIQVRLFGKAKLPIANVQFFNGDQIELRLSDIDNKVLTGGYNNYLKLGKKAK